MNAYLLGKKSLPGIKFYLNFRVRELGFLISVQADFG